MNRSHLVSLVAIGLMLGGLTAIAADPSRVPVNPAPGAPGGFPAGLPGMPAGMMGGMPAAEPLVLSDVSFASTPLPVVLGQMTEKDPRFVYTLVRDPGVPMTSPEVSVTAKSIEYSELLMLVAKTYPQVVVTRVPGSGNVYAIRIQAPDAPAPTSVKVYRIPEDYPVSGLDLTTADPKLQKLLDKPLPELKFDQAKLSEVIDFLRDLTGANIVVQWPELSAYGVEPNALVSLRLRDVKFSKALRELLSGRGVELACVAEEGVITIGGPNLAAGSRSSAAILSLIEAAVAQVPGPSPTLKFHEATHTLIVKGTQEQQAAVSQAVAAVTAETLPAKNATTQQAR